VRFLTNNVTAEQQAVFVDAANRWASIITDDLSNIDLPGPTELSPDAAAVEGTIDDLLIDAAFTDIDGPGSILGRAGPRFIRTTGDDAPLTIYGIMEFDVAEFAPGGFFDDPKGYADVILHEMGHVLGIGTLWDFTGNLEGFDPNAPTDLPLGIPNPNYDPRFIGAMAVAEYDHLLTEAGKAPEAGVPVENTGGGGSISAHWRELTFDNELMSPAASGSELLSKLTAASLGDLGYTVDLGSSAIDSYQLPPEGVFTQIAPTPRTYVYQVDFLKLSGGIGNTTGTVQGVDLKIDESADPNDPASGHPVNSTSGCEAEDFSGFTAGNIALIQRGFCAFLDKVANAEAAGATGVIIFNQGNDETPARRGLFGAASTGLPGVSVSFALGLELAATSGLEVSIDSGLPNPSMLGLAAKAPNFDEEILLPIGTISPTGKFSPLPNR
jgi:PA domain/Leishmanolysin